MTSARMLMKSGIVVERLRSHEVQTDFVRHFLRLDVDVVEHF